MFFDDDTWRERVKGNESNVGTGMYATLPSLSTGMTFARECELKSELEMFWRYEILSIAFLL